MDPITVVGGGLTGLLLTDWLSNKYPKRPVVVIESEKECGGLLRSFDYGPEFGKFDYGTHIMSETLHKDLDDYLIGLLPEDRWNFLVDSHRDLSSMFFNGRIQTVSPYPDLRDLPDDLHARCLKDFMSNYRNKEWENATNVHDRLVGLLGKTIAEEVILPRLEAFWGKSSKDLMGIAGRLLPVEQVFLFREPPSEELRNDPDIKWRLVLEDQRDYHYKKRCFYPVTPGIDQVVNAVIERLKKKGADVRTGTEIVKVTQKGKSNVTLHFKDESELTTNHVYWTGHLLQLAPVCGIPVNYGGMDKPYHTVLCHYIVDQIPEILKDCYHCFCMDSAVQVFRITNYRNYCPGADRACGYPLTVEMILNDEKFAQGNFLEKGIADLKTMKVLPEKTNVHFQKLELIKYGFPRPTIANANEIGRVRDKINDSFGDNITLFGILSKRDLFFMKDVFLDAWQYCKNL